MEKMCLKIALCFSLLSLSLLAPAAYCQSFTISALINTLSVEQGASTTTQINVVASGGFNAPITLTASGLPTGATISNSPALTGPYPASTTLTITAGSSGAQAAPYSVIIMGTSGAISASTTTPISLTVTQPANGDTLSASDNLKNNFGFGIALGLSWNVTGPDIVNSATIDANGIVRVDTRANTNAGFMLETHYYIWPRPTPEVLADNTKPDNRSWGTGPFVAAQPGSSQIISSVGAGWMLGLRRPKGDVPSGFGLGVGYQLIPAAQVLGSEFVNGQKAPVAPDGTPIPIRYETEDKGSVLFILSISF